MAHKDTCVALSNAIIVDFRAYRLFGVGELVAAQVLFKEKNLPIKFIEDMAPYRNHDVLKMKLANGTALPEHLEYFLERPLIDKEIELIDATNKCIACLHELIKPEIAAYVLAPVPNDSERVMALISFRPDRIVRNGHTAGHKAMTAIWLKAFGFWNGLQHGNTADRDFLEGINIGGERNKRVQINADYVTIGCQSIPRWEVEQIAIRLGLFTPTA